MKQPTIAVRELTPDTQILLGSADWCIDLRREFPDHCLIVMSPDRRTTVLYQDGADYLAAMTEMRRLARAGSYGFHILRVRREGDIPMSQTPVDHIVRAAARSRAAAQDGGDPAHEAEEHGGVEVSPERG